MPLPADIQDFVRSTFALEDREAASALLASARIEDGTFASDRLLRCAAFAARGDLARLGRYVSMLAIDWRDVVVAGEYELRDGATVWVRDLERPMSA
jgi:hypothetical protein